MKLIGGNRTLPLPPPPPPRPVIFSDVANESVAFCTRFGLPGWIRRGRRSRIMCFRGGDLADYLFGLQRCFNFALTTVTG